MAKLSDEEEDTIYTKTIQSKQFGLSKADMELFKDEDYKPTDVIHVKRIDLPKKAGEDWEIYVNDEVALVLKGTRFTNKEKEFFKTVDGIRFLMSSFKNGAKSVVKIKELLKNVK